MKPLVSVIVPVYNNEEFVEKCIDSLIGQTYENVEIVLIDDGSKDNSGAICDKYGEKEKNIVVVHQENGGVSAARNAGMKAMHGEFVTFVDGDDYVSDDFVECLYNALERENADISTCGHYRVSTKGDLKRIYKLSKNPDEIICMSGYDSIKNMFYGDICSASCGSKLYKIELFEDLSFPPFIMGEDTFIVYHCFSKAKKVAHTNKPMYYYVQHSSSVTNSKRNFIKFYDYVKLYDYIFSIDKNMSDKDYKASLVNRLIENNFWVYMKLRNCPGQYEDEKTHIVDNIKKYRSYVIKDERAERRVRMACVLSYGGMRFLNMVYDNMNKRWK